MLTMQFVGLLSGWMITGALFLLLGWFGSIGQILSLVTPLIVYLWWRMPPIRPKKEPLKNISALVLLTTTGLLLIALALLFLSSTTESIRSVWDVLPRWWILFPLLSAILVSTSLRHSDSGVQWSVESLLWLTILSVGVAIFPLGYGFDQHIHEATLQNIISTGSLYPITPYYLGYYGLLLSFQPILTLFDTIVVYHILNQWFVPVLAALLLPACRRYLHHKNITPALWQWFAWLLIPWVYFTHTNPQTLGLLWLLLTVIFLYTEHEALAVLLAIASLTLHPISGIAALIAVVFLLSDYWLNRWSIGKIFVQFRHHSFGQALLVIGSSLLVPASFFIGTLGVGADVGFDFTRILPFTNVQLSPLADPWYGLVYGWVWNRFWWLILIVCIGAWILRARASVFGNISRKKLLLGFISIQCGALMAYYIRGIPDTGGTDMAIYAQRFSYAGILLVLPMMIVYTSTVFEYFSTSVRWIRLYGLSLIVFVIAIGWYALYPGNDYGYMVSASFNVGLADRHAVKWIHQDSPDQRFLVLANQTVAASAIQQYGFRDYFEISGIPKNQPQRSQVFYYSIPTGGAVYPYYLEFLKHPNRALINELQQKTGARRVYVVVNAYWTESQRTIARSIPIADHMMSIDNGRAWVFRFDTSL